MRKLLAILCFTVSSSFLTIQAQTWLWAKEATPKSNSSGGDIFGDHGIALDRKGNIISTGTFWDTISFGAFQLGCMGNQLFVAKFGPTGNPLWALQPVSGLSNDSYGFSIATDDSNNIYATGQFTDSMTVGTFNLAATNCADAFIIKCDPNGNVKWAKQSLSNGNYNDAYGSSIAADASGNTYVAGYFTDTVSFGLFTLISPNINAEEGFLVKYNASGNVLWAKQSSAVSLYGSASFASVALDASGNVLITGNFLDTISFGSYNLSSQEYQFFVVKFDANGNVIWAKQTSTPSHFCQSYGYSIAIDIKGNAYVTGKFSDTISFGTHTLKNVSNHYEPFLSKYDSIGNTIWAEQGYALDSNDWIGSSIATDTLASGGGYLTLNGRAIGPYKILFGSDTFKVNTTNNSGTLFFQFDSAGRIQCGNVFTEGDEDDGDAVCVSHSGTSVYLGGDVYTQTIFGLDTLIYGNDMPFIAQWQSCSQNNEDVNNLQTNNLRVVLYPNPNIGEFTIELSGVSGQSLVEVYNMLGEKIYCGKLNTTTTQLDLSDNASGVYLYRVLTETGALFSDGKFVIQK